MGSRRYPPIVPSLIHSRSRVSNGQIKVLHRRRRRPIPSLEGGSGAAPSARAPGHRSHRGVAQLSPAAALRIVSLVSDRDILVVSPLDRLTDPRAVRYPHSHPQGGAV